MSERAEASKLATAALMDIISRGQAIQAAVIRGASEPDIARLRGEAHDILDAYLDHTSSAAHHTASELMPKD